MTDTRRTRALPTWFAEPVFAARFAAALIDAVLFVVVGLVVAMVVVDPGPRRYLLPAIAALYSIGAVTLAGATIGKRLLGLRVVRLASGDLPGLGAAAVRWLVPAAPGLLALGAREVQGLPSGGGSAVTTLAGVVVYLGVLVPPLHRGLHDRAAGTVVTRVLPLGFGA